jgi:hypothetical protein
MIALNLKPIYAAHPGRNHTLAIVSLRYWWPEKRRVIDAYVGECDDCHLRKQAHEYRVPVGEVRQSTYATEICHMDICGLYDVSAKKIKYVLTIVDHLTEYAETVPIVDL